MQAWWGQGGFYQQANVICLSFLFALMSSKVFLKHLLVITQHLNVH